jgi:ADP-ribosylglycohydrolase
VSGPAEVDCFRGCLLGGAVGDALGAPVEFMSLDEIRKRFGPRGVTGLVDGAWPAGSITDDTQMTLFTAEGLLRAQVRGALKGIVHPPTVVDHAYARWLHTQGERSTRWAKYNEDGYDGWLIGLPELNARRARPYVPVGAFGRAGRHGRAAAERLKGVWRGDADRAGWSARAA